jgi:hypothetical protein
MGSDGGEGLSIGRRYYSGLALNISPAIPGRGGHKFRFRFPFAGGGGLQIHYPFLFSFCPDWNAINIRDDIIYDERRMISIYWNNFIITRIQQRRTVKWINI